MLAFPPEHSNDLPDDVICNDAIMLMILLSNLSVNKHRICSKQELAPELASVLQDTLEWGMKGIVVSTAEKK